MDNIEECKHEDDLDLLGSEKANNQELIQNESKLNLVDPIGSSVNSDEKIEEIAPGIDLDEEESELNKASGAKDTLAKTKLINFLGAIKNIVGSDGVEAVDGFCTEKHHSIGEAADIRIKGLSARQTERLIQSRFGTEIKAIGRNDAINFVHIDFRDEATTTQIRFGYNMLNQITSHYD